MFEDEKIRILESMPDADTLLIIWIKLICMAGRVNDNGYIYLSKELPYTEEEMATILNRQANTVRLALLTFQRLKMIEWTEDGIYITNFTKHQNTAGLTKIREQQKLRTRVFREKQKLLGINNDNVTQNVTLRNVTVTQQNKNKNKNKNVTVCNGSYSKDIWEKTLQILNEKTLSVAFRVYLKGTSGIEIDDEKIYVGIDSMAKVKYIDSNIYLTVKRALDEASGTDLSIEFVIEGVD